MLIAFGMATFTAIHYRKLEWNESQMQMAYNKARDERRQAIRVKSGLPMLLYLSVLMILAGIIAGYFNQTAIVTRIITAYCQMLIPIIAKVYYSKMM